jgi:glycosyltransferase involved in cell wall biosynthesis
MVGDGPEREAAVSMARRLNVAASVHFLGAQSAIVRYLSAADLFLMPSESEAFGLAALEALACETPVIGARAGGLPEVVEDGVCGALEAVGDVEAMARRAIEILETPGLREKMGKAGRQRAIERFSLDAIVSQYEALYERALAG